MKSNFSKVIGILGAVATAVTLGKLDFAKASGEQFGNQADGLADQMIDKNMFKMDTQTNEIKVDTDALVESLRAEIVVKINSPRISKNKKDTYEVILQNLKPGSYEAFHGSAQDLSSMHFDKKGN